MPSFLAKVRSAGRPPLRVYRELQLSLLQSFPLRHGNTQDAHSEGTGDDVSGVVFGLMPCRAGGSDFGKFQKTGEENGKEEREGEWAGA